MSRFARYAWLVVLYNLAVIAWGAYVRATGSGAGCGDHWPLCNGEVVPRSPDVEMLIEFSHRLSSGLDGLLILGLFFWALRAAGRGSPARRWAGATLALVIVEGGLGAGLVKYQLVADDQSMARGVAMAAHLCNTFLLLAAATLTAWSASGGADPRRVRPRVAGILGAALGATMILGMSGAIAALGDTLFPVASFAEGLSQDRSPAAHLFVRLRVLHPVIAALVGLGLIGLSLRCMDRWPGSAGLRRAGRLLIGLVVAQLVLGAVNVALAAPVWLQLVHLVVADALWLSLVVLSAEILLSDGAEPAVLH